MGTYSFTSDQSCELCEALAGWYEAEPPRPHQNCDCLIEERKAALADFPAFRYSILDKHRDQQRPNEAYVAEVEVWVKCFDGTEIKEIIHVTFESADDPEVVGEETVLDKIEAQLAEDAEAFAADVATSCGNDDGYDAEIIYEEPVKNADTITYPVIVVIKCVRHQRTVRQEKAFEYPLPVDLTPETNEWEEYYYDKIEDEVMEFVQEVANDCPDVEIQGRDVDNDFEVV